MRANRARPRSWRGFYRPPPSRQSSSQKAWNHTRNDGLYASAVARLAELKSSSRHSSIGDAHCGPRLDDDFRRHVYRLVDDLSRFIGVHGVDLEPNLFGAGKKRLVPQRQIESLAQEGKTIRGDTGRRDVGLSERVLLQFTPRAGATEQLRGL